MRRVKRISGAYCTQMDLFTFICREVGEGGLDSHCCSPHWEHSAAGQQHPMPGLVVCLQPKQQRFSAFFLQALMKGTEGF